MLFHLQINPGGGISIITHETDQLLQKTSIVIPGLVVHCTVTQILKFLIIFPLWLFKISGSITAKLQDALLHMAIESVY